MPRSWVPWIVAGVCLALTIGAGTLAARFAEDAKEQKGVAQAATDSAKTLLAALEARDGMIMEAVDSMNAYWEGVIDSLTVAPPPLPELDPRYRALLDTANLAREVRQAMDAVLAQNDSLRARDVRREARIRDLRATSLAMADSINAFWMAERERDREVINQLTIAMEENAREADRWEAAYYSSQMAWYEKVGYGVVGFAAGYATNRLVTGGN